MSSGWRSNLFKAPEKPLQEGQAFKPVADPGTFMVVAATLATEPAENTCPPELRSRDPILVTWTQQGLEMSCWCPGEAFGLVKPE
jgi:hypothetical protein